MKILHVCDNLFAGGVQQIMINTIDGMPEYEHHVIYLAKIENLKSRVNAPCIYVKQEKGIMLLKTVWQIYDYIKRNKIDIVASGVFNAFFLSRLAVIFLPKVKHLTVYQATWFVDQLHKAKFFAKLDKLTHFKRFNYIAVSNAVKKHVFDKVNPSYKKIDVVYNCADDYYYQQLTHQRNFESKTQLKFIFIGNNFPEKNIIYLVNLFASLDPSKFQLSIVGGWMDPFEKITSEKNITNITFHGIKKVTIELLNEHDVYIASGIGEGSPLATIEAMAIGLPTILASTEAYLEVTNSVGFFFNPLDLNDGIEKIKDLYNNQQKLKEISNHHISFARNFTKNKYLDSMRVYYKNMLNK
jgi:glycosyltransferase involved in cell wall biosynthesis